VSHQANLTACLSNAQNSFKTNQIPPKQPINSLDVQKPRKYKIAL